MLKQLRVGRLHDCKWRCRSFHKILCAGMKRPKRNRDEFAGISKRRVIVGEFLGVKSPNGRKRDVNENAFFGFRFMERLAPRPSGVRRLGNRTDGTDMQIADEAPPSLGSYGRWARTNRLCARARMRMTMRLRMIPPCPQAAKFSKNRCAMVFCRVGLNLRPGLLGEKLNFVWAEI